MARGNSLTNRIVAHDPSDDVQTLDGSAVSWQRFSVSYDYPVVFSDDVLHGDNRLLRDTLCRLEPHKRHRLIVFLDAGLAASCPALADRVTAYCTTHADRLDLVCQPLIVPGGEAVKRDWTSLAPLQRAVAAHGIDRHSYILGIGGGALLDAVGLVAATAHRGIRHVRLPSTVLAQNDSGVGVKNAINQFRQKNYLGTFAPPFAVLNDASLLATLPAAERLAGMAEAVKVALIRDAAFFAWLEQEAPALRQHEPQALHYLIRHCAELHMQQIGQGGDPFEQGCARPLDFGHWAAHRLETLSDHTVRHGFAVAIGIALDTRYSVLAGFLQVGADERVARLLETLGFELWHPLLEARTDAGHRRVIVGLEQFRAHLGGELTITLLAAIGRGHEVHVMDTALIIESLDWLKTRRHA